MRLKRAIRAVIALYPRRWRERYGEDLEHLTLEVLDVADSTPLVAVADLVRGAATEWLFALRIHPATFPVIAALSLGGMFAADELHQRTDPSASQPAITAIVRSVTQAARLSIFPQQTMIGPVRVTQTPITGAATAAQGAPVLVTLNPHTDQTLSITPAPAGQDPR